MTIQNLSTYVNRQSRNNLFFISNEVEDIKYVDIGRLLSGEIENSLEKKRLGMIAEDALRKILSRGSVANEHIGEYLAIKNIGILFEPALKLDVLSILKNWSRDHILIVKHEGEIREGVFYLVSNSTKQTINLKESKILTLAASFEREITFFCGRWFTSCDGLDF